MKNLDGPLFDLHDDRCHGLHILCPPRTFLPLNETSTDICPPHPPKKKTMFSACQLYKYRDQTKGSMHVLRSMYTVL
jgi:hypothetical protein